MDAEIKVLEWNLNYGSSKETMLAPFCKNYIKNFDVMIFTEAIYNKSFEELIRNLNEEIYDTQASKYGEPFVSIDHGGNQVIIVVREDLHGVPQFNRIPNVDISPDFVQIEIDVEGIKYQIIGCRILTDIGKPTDKDYKDRYAQFCNIVSHIKGFDNVVLLGDMNNGMIKADSSKEYKEVKSEYQFTRDGKLNPLRFYNFHLMPA